MSTEHDSLTVDPRLERLLRGTLASDDLQPAQNERVRARLGLLTTEPTATATLTIPAARAQLATPEPEAAPITAPSHTRLRRQWLQFALAAVAFIAVGVLLALLFGSGNDNPDSRTGATDGSDQAVREALVPLPEGQERRMVLDVEAHNGTDNAFDQWSIELWQHWTIADKADEGLYVSDPSGEVVTHIVLDAQASLLNWEPKDALQTFDVPLEYFLQRRVLDATLAAVNDPESYNLHSETQDGQVVLTYEWSDDDSREFNYVNRGEAWIDPQTGKLQRIVHLIDRPDQEPYPTRTFTIRRMEILPAGSSPADMYTIGGATNSPAPTATAGPTRTATVDSALPIPDETGTYNGITLEQARQIVPFEIAVPLQVPDGLKAPSISVVESPPLAAGGRVYRVEMYFELSGDESPSKSVLFTQIASPGTGNPPEGETFTFTTQNGIEMNRTTSTNAAGDQGLVYWWENNDIDYQILAAPEGDLTPGLVEDLMLSIIVPPAPTADEETARLEQERAEMMPFPIPDTCAASDWSGPDFRVGQQYPTAYFLDGDGLSLWTTHGLLFAGENRITWLADAPLTTTEALSGPETIRAVQSGADGATTEIPIDITEQLYNVRDTERAWWSTVSFPSEGCWEIKVSLGVHTLSATVYVYPQPSSGEFPLVNDTVTGNFASAFEHSDRRSWQRPS